MKLKNVIDILFQKNSANIGSKTFPLQYQFNLCVTLKTINFGISNVNICGPKAV